MSADKNLKTKLRQRTLLLLFYDKDHFLRGESYQPLSFDIKKLISDREYNISVRKGKIWCMKDIGSLDDIKRMVDTFYLKIRQDDLLGHIFESVIRDQWNVHLEKMLRFWQTLLFREKTYFGQPFPPHQYMALREEHFTRWLALFDSTVDDLFEGPVADEAKSRARSIAVIFNAKLNPDSNKLRADK